MVDIQTFSIAVASASVTLAAIYYVWQFRHQTKIRQMDLFMRLWTFGSTDEFMGALEKVNGLQFKDCEDYVAKHGSFLSEDPMARALWRVFSFYELMGTLLYRKLIDIESVYEIAGSGYPKMLYEKLKPIVLGIRREVEPSFEVGFEYLVNELSGKEPQLKEMWKKAVST
jgi:hypothetical protein